MTPLAMLLALAALLGIGRLLWWQAKSLSPSQPWRLAALIALHPVVASLLWLTLEPPNLPGNAGTLVVATAGAPRRAALAAGEALVALPEAANLPGAIRVPDLDTALRRHPGTTRLRIIGHGLPPRDQIASALPIAFDPAPLPRGLVSLTPPAIVAPGAGFRVGGVVHDVSGGRVELLDPAGRAVASAPLDATGTFALAATARAAGPAAFTVRVTDRRRRLVETAVVPVVAVEGVQPRLLIVAGSAGPDLKYLRRWATDAGIAVGTSIAAGNGLDLGDAAPRLDTASLDKLDLLVLDERSWAAMREGSRAQVIAAVRAGLGVLLRVTGPLPDATRREWAALGLASDDAIQPLRLSGDGPGLARVATASTAADVPLHVRDTSGGPVAHWRSVGRGRIALWPVTDLYALVLAGDAARHAAIWSEVFATLARPQSGSPPRISPDATPGQRLTICNLTSPASVRHPDGAVTTLVVDAGCAAFWPSLPGWHELRTPVAMPFLVAPIGAGRTAAQTSAATINLAYPGTARVMASPVRGASWPWFVAWVVASALLWGFERSRIGRTAPMH